MVSGPERVPACACNGNDAPLTPPPVPGSPGDNEQAEAEEKREEILANEDTWYTSLELHLRLLRLYKGP